MTNPIRRTSAVALAVFAVAAPAAAADPVSVNLRVEGQSQTIFDGMLRPRQTQSQDGAGSANAVVTDTFYDSRGLKSRENTSYWNDGAAGTTLGLLPATAHRHAP